MVTCEALYRTACLHTYLHQRVLNSAQPQKHAIYLYRRTLFAVCYTRVPFHYWPRACSRQDARAQQLLASDNILPSDDHTLSKISCSYVQYPCVRVNETLPYNRSSCGSMPSNQRLLSHQWRCAAETCISMAYSPPLPTSAISRWYSGVRCAGRLSSVAVHKYRQALLDS